MHGIAKESECSESDPEQRKFDSCIFCTNHEKVTHLNSTPNFAKDVIKRPWVASYFNNFRAKSHSSHSTHDFFLSIQITYLSISCPLIHSPSPAKQFS
jgi:hypothetical protein